MKHIPVNMYQTCTFLNAKLKAYKKKATCPQSKCSQQGKHIHASELPLWRIIPADRTICSPRLGIVVESHADNTSVVPVVLPDHLLTVKLPESRIVV